MNKGQNWPISNSLCHCINFIFCASPYLVSLRIPTKLLPLLQWPEQYIFFRILYIQCLKFPYLSLHKTDHIVCFQTDTLSRCFIFLVFCPRACWSLYSCLPSSQTLNLSIFPNYPDLLNCLTSLFYHKHIHYWYFVENFCESLFHSKRQCNIIEPTENGKAYNEWRI